MLKITKATKKEIEVRGKIMMLACDIEFCLLNIIMFCNPDPNNHERAGQFKKMRMGGKIECVICDMQKYKPNYYNALKSYFDGLEEFKEVRNHFAHYKGDFPDEPDLRKINLAYIEEDETGAERMRYITYADSDIEIFVAKFSSINGALAAPWMQLKKEFDAISGVHPFVYLSTDSVLPNNP